MSKQRKASKEPIGAEKNTPSVPQNASKPQDDSQVKETAQDATQGNLETPSGTSVSLDNYSKDLDTCQEELSNALKRIDELQTTCSLQEKAIADLERKYRFLKPTGIPNFEDPKLMKLVAEMLIFSLEAKFNDIPFPWWIMLYLTACNQGTAGVSLRHVKLLHVTLNEYIDRYSTGVNPAIKHGVLKQCYKRALQHMASMKEQIRDDEKKEFFEEFTQVVGHQPWAKEMSSASAK